MALGGLYARAGLVAGRASSSESDLGGHPGRALECGDLTMDHGRDPGWDSKREIEAERIRRVYRRRATSDARSRYSPTSPVTIMAVQERERHVLHGLRTRGLEPDDLDCLDIGCGTGGELARLIASGANPGRLHGVDLRSDAIATARGRLPLCDFVVGDATDLPFATHSMDLVTQLTVLTSILDHDVRARVAAEMVRVCRPTGLIVSYDFALNPTNPETRGLSAREIRRLFAGCTVETHRVTLAPPIARRIAPRSRRLAALLNALPPLRSHLIAFVEPPDPNGIARRR